MRIERHIFGSLDGYRTLAHSSGLTAAECKALEGFAFGTPYDPAVRATFKADPAYWSRPIGGTRRAITRITLGDPDDAGRPTLLFVTAVIADQDWNFQLHGDARPIMGVTDLWRWDRSGRLKPFEAGPLAPSPWRLSGPSVQRVLGLVSLVEPAWSFNQPVIVREGSYSLDEVMAVERLLPPGIRSGFSVLYRSIQSQMPVSLNCLARSVTADSSRPCRQLVGPVSPYARVLARQGVTDGRLPLEFIQAYRRFSQPEVETGPEYAEDDVMPDVRSGARPRQGLRAALGTCLPVVVLIALIALVLGGVIGWAAKPAEANPWPGFTFKVLGIPPIPGDRQIAGIQAVQDEARKQFPGNAAPTPAGSPDQKADHRTRLAGLIASLAENAKLAHAAEVALDAVTVDHPESLVRAEEAVAALNKKDPETPDAYTPRVEQLKSMLDELARTKRLNDGLERAAARPSLDELASKLEKKIQEVLDKHPANSPDSQTGSLTEADRSEIQNLLATLSTLEQIEPACVRAAVSAPRQSLADLLARHPASETGDAQGAKADDWPREIRPIVDFLKSNPDPKATKESAEQLAGALSDTRGNLESRKDLGVLRDVFGELAQWVSQLASLPPSSDATSRPADEELERAFAACCKAAREFRLQKKLVRESGSPNRDGLQKARQEYTKAMDELKQLFENRAGNRA